MVREGLRTAGFSEELKMFFTCGKNGSFKPMAVLSSSFPIAARVFGFQLLIIQVNDGGGGD
jgi:hypothetical protein